MNDINANTCRNIVQSLEWVKRLQSTIFYNRKQLRLLYLLMKYVINNKTLHEFVEETNQVIVFYM